MLRAGLLLVSGSYAHHKNFTQTETAAYSALLYLLFGFRGVVNFHSFWQGVKDNATTAAIASSLLWKGIRLGTWWHAQRCGDTEMVDASWLITPFMAHCTHHTNYRVGGKMITHCYHPLLTFDC